MKSKVGKSKKGKPVRHHRFNKRGKRKFYKSAVGREVMINKSRANQHDTIAPRFRTKMMLEFCGNTTATTSTAATFWAVGGNTMIQALNTGNPFTLTTGSGPSGVIIGSNTITTLFPGGYAQMNKLYSYFRVYSSKIQMYIQPIGSPVLTSIARLVVTPANSLAVIAVNPEQCYVQPYGKATMITPYNTTSQNTITHYMDTSTVWGVTKRAVQDDDRFAVISGTAPANEWFWGIWFEPLDGGTAAYTISFKITYYVEWYNKNLVTESVT